jgi:hypothetical protein
MNWKKSLSEFLIPAGVYFPVLYLSGWKRRGPFFTSHNLIQSALTAIATGLIIVGLNELRRGGHQKIRRMLWRTFFAWIAIIIVFVVSAIALHQWALLDSALDYIFYLSFALCAVPLALALYLNRKQLKSTLQPTTHNAS